MPVGRRQGGISELPILLVMPSKFVVEGRVRIKTGASGLLYQLGLCPVNSVFDVAAQPLEGEERPYRGMWRLRVIRSLKVVVQTARCSGSTSILDLEHPRSCDAGYSFRAMFPLGTGGHTSGRDMRPAEVDCLGGE